MAKETTTNLTEYSKQIRSFEMNYIKILSLEVNLKNSLWS